MARLPIATTVVPVRALARRIVLTRAATPTGTADQAFMTVRLRRLLDAGMLDEAADLAAMARSRMIPSLRASRPRPCCLRASRPMSAMTRRRRGSRAREPFWIELRAYCYAIGGDGDAFALTRSVMDAQNINDDAFDTLLDDVQQQRRRRIPAISKRPMRSMSSFCARSDCR